VKKTAIARALSCNPATRLLQKTDTRILDDFDDLVLRGCNGDARAVGAIAMAVGPRLLREAIDELGFDFADDGGDVLQDFFVAMLEGRCRFVPAHERAGPWMNRVVRAIARAHRDGRERDWGIDDLS
jgi:hypothetical protein